jgi:hypothetical protein
MKNEDTKVAKIGHSKYTLNLAKQDSLQNVGSPRLHSKF